MIYKEYSVGGELMHSAKGTTWAGAKYIDKVRTKTGKWRYIYDTKITGKTYKKRRDQNMQAYINDSGRAFYKQKPGANKTNADRIEEMQAKRLATARRNDFKYNQSLAGKAEDAKTKVLNAANAVVIKGKNAVDDILEKLNKKKKKK